VRRRRELNTLWHEIFSREFNFAGAVFFFHGVSRKQIFANFDFRLSHSEQIFAGFLQVSLLYLTYITCIQQQEMGYYLITQSYQKMWFCMLSGLGETHSQLFFLFFGRRWSLSWLLSNLPRECRDYSLCCDCKAQGPNILFTWSKFSPIIFSLYSGRLLSWAQIFADQWKIQLDSAKISCHADDKQTLLADVWLRPGAVLVVPPSMKWSIICHLSTRLVHVIWWSTDPVFKFDVCPIHPKKDTTWCSQ